MEIEKGISRNPHNKREEARHNSTNQFIHKYLEGGD